MKGNEKIIEKLNDLLADELTAINQYMVHSEMCDNWGYERLHEKIEKRAIDEMKHAEKLIARILFLEGRPIVSNLKKINIGAEVPRSIKTTGAPKMTPSRATTTESGSPWKSATTAPGNSWIRSSRTRKIISTGSKLNSTKSSRWASQITWWNRSINLAGRGVG